MTREELINFGEMYLEVNNDSKNSNTYEFIEEAVKLFKQEPCEDEIILTKEEYGQLLSNEFDNGYAKGYREALEQEDSILDKIKIGHIREAECFRAGINVTLNIIDKYKAESEDKE